VHGQEIPVMATRNSYLLLGVFLVALGLGAGCGKGTPEENFRLWSNNKEGWNQIGLYVKDKNNPIDLRAKALLTLVETSHGSVLKDVIKDVPDKPELLALFKEGVVKDFKDPSDELQRRAKEALFHVIDDMSAKDQEATRKLIAEWAFAGLSSADAAEKIKAVIEKRVTDQEIVKLGTESIVASQLLLEKGLSRKGISIHLSTLKTPEAAHALVEGYKKLHQDPKMKITTDQIGFIQGTGTAEAASYLLELYTKLNKSTHPDDKAAAGDAINAAIVMMADAKIAEEIKKERPKIEPMLTSFLKADKSDDRLLGAQYLIEWNGPDMIGKVIDELPDDQHYAMKDFASNDIKLLLTDLCNDQVAAKADKDVVIAQIEPRLQAKSPFARAFAVTCLKAIGNEKAEKLLQAVAKDKAQAKVQVWMYLVLDQGFTIAQLAQNAVDTIAYRREIDALVKAGKLTQKEGDKRKFYAKVDYQEVGKNLAAKAEYRAKKALDAAAAKEKEAANPKK